MEYSDGDKRQIIQGILQVSFSISLSKGNLNGATILLKGLGRIKRTSVNLGIDLELFAMP